MAVYAKICIICQKKFYAMKVNKMFCSKTCSNRTRYLPKELVASLVQRNSQYMIKASKYVAMIQDDSGRETSIGYEPPDVTTENPLGKDAGYLIALAKMKREQRDNDERLEKEKQEIADISSGFSVIGDNKQEDDTDDIPDLSNIFDKDEPKKYKIRKIGG